MELACIKQDFPPIIIIMELLYVRAKTMVFPDANSSCSTLVKFMICFQELEQILQWELKSSHKDIFNCCIVVRFPVTKTQFLG